MALRLACRRVRDANDRLSWVTMVRLCSPQGPLRIVRYPKLRGIGFQRTRGVAPAVFDKEEKNRTRKPGAVGHLPGDSSVLTAPSLLSRGMPDLVPAGLWATCLHPTSRIFFRQRHICCADQTSVIILYSDPQRTRSRRNLQLHFKR